MWRAGSVLGVDGMVIVLWPWVKSVVVANSCARRWDGADGALMIQIVERANNRWR